MPTASISPPAIYRAIDAAGRAKDGTKGCTIFLDESDNRSISGLMLSVLNSGHYRHLAYIPRVVRGEPYNFSTFTPILIATRGRTLKSNLRSRTLEFQMHPALPEDCSDRTTPPYRGCNVRMSGLSDDSSSFFLIV